MEKANANNPNTCTVENEQKCNALCCIPTKPQKPIIKNGLDEYNGETQECER